MKNNEIEKKIYEEFEEKKPELFNEILKQCPEMTKSKETVSFFEKLSKVLRSKKMSYSFASFSLVFLAILLFMPGNNSSPEVYAIIAIDVNPSVVIEIDKNDDVISIELNNQDAAIILGDMDLIGIDYNIAVNALIGSMVTNGYITDINNSVLLSVSSDNNNKEQDLITELTTYVNDLLEVKQIEGSVIIQHLEFEDDAEELSELLNISEAKAELILDIIEADPRMVVEELALLSINDLNLLLEQKNIVLDNVEKTGEASELGFISKNEAYSIALLELGIEESDVIEFDIELEQENGIMIYEIEIETVSDEYELIVHAKNGTILNEEPKDEDEFPDDTLTESELIDIIVSELNLDRSKIVELEIDEESDNNIAFFEVSFEYEDIDYELEVDAISGEIYAIDDNEDESDDEADDETDDESEEEIDD